MGKFKNDNNYDKYRIKGKTYYKVGDKPVSETDRDFVSEIWLMKNANDEDFTLIIRRSKISSTFSLYKSDGPLVYRTYSISKVEAKK